MNSAVPTAVDATEVIYEVECSLDPSIVAAFDAWLPGHVRDVLASPGFLDAETLRPTDAPNDGRIRRVNRYRVRDRGALDHYLEQVAPGLRQDGIARFGDRATYSRRVYTATPYGSAAERCANCEAPLRGHYCAECGQHARESARSLGTLYHDAWHVLTHVDGRFWQTLRRLAFSPGFLTNEYFAERRARYIPPFRLYIVLSLIFFGLTSVSSVFDGDPIKLDPQDKRATQQELQKDAAEIARAKQELATDSTVPASIAKAALEQADRRVQQKLTDADAKSGGGAGANPAAQPTPDDEKRDGVFFDTKNCEEMALKPAWLARHFGKGMQAACVKMARDGGNSLMKSIGAHIPKMMFVFLPLIAAVMLLLYWFPRRYYVEHLVFFLHVHAGLFLLFSALLLVSIVGSVVPAVESFVGVFGIAAFFYSVWYVWRAMRVHYRNGALLTFVKGWIIFFAYCTCLMLTLMGTALFSVLTV